MHTHVVHIHKKCGGTVDVFYANDVPQYIKCGRCDKKWGQLTVPDDIFVGVAFMYKRYTRSLVSGMGVTTAQFDPYASVE